MPAEGTLLNQSPVACPHAGQIPLDSLADFTGLYLPKMVNLEQFF
jgi:hypothetical protein